MQNAKMSLSVGKGIGSLCMLLCWMLVAVNGQAYPSPQGNPSPPKGAGSPSPGANPPASIDESSIDKITPSADALVPPGKKPTKEEWANLLCKVTPLQPNAVCSSPGEGGDANEVSDRDQDYCKHLGKLFSFTRTCCSTVYIEPADSPYNQSYTIDACALSYLDNPNPEDVKQWIFISSKSQKIPSSYVVAACNRNPLVIYNVL